MPQNKALYAAPLVGAAFATFALLVGQLALVSVVCLLTIGWIVGWFVLAYQYEVVLHAAEAGSMANQPASDGHRA